YRSVALLFTGVVGLPIIAYLAQEKFIYFPDRRYFLEPKSWGFNDNNFKELMLQTKDGLTIHCWFIKQKNSKGVPTILYCHGNGGNMSYGLPTYWRLSNQVGCNLFVLSYRGYGKSDGSPMESGIKKDIDACIEYLMSDESIDPEKLVIYGLSLGGAVAINTSMRYPDKIKANIFVNTFLSIPDMMDNIMGSLVLLKPLIKNKWMSKNSIRSITTPILFLSGREDTVVPPQHMDKLEELAINSSQKEIIRFEKYGHNDTENNAGYSKHIKEFLIKVFGEWSP
ncbi:hypothetical protein SAMD00019534_061010, partial [Acytostelium subglobosum LB1]|uniref:hypothetical protein n=1 Tax=Acytostelium subglobosum LB1 TaxID=1410327 RepID=UPI0006450BD6